MQPTLNIGPLSAQASDVDDTALQCLLIVAALHDLCADEAQLRREFGSAPQTLQSLRLAAARIGFTSKVIAQNPARWSQAPLPAIAIQRDGSYCVVAQFQEEPVPKLLIHRPGSAPRILTLSEFDMSWSGQLIYLSASSKESRAAAKFDLGWFIPAIIRYRRLLAEVLLASVVLQVIALGDAAFLSGGHG